MTILGPGTPLISGSSFGGALQRRLPTRNLSLSGALCKLSLVESAPCPILAPWPGPFLVEDMDSPELIEGVAVAVPSPILFLFLLGAHVRVVLF